VFQPARNAPHRGSGRWTPTGASQPPAATALKEAAMLSDVSRPVIAATLPVVGEHIGEIARRFYAHMFDARPDLIDGLFNRGNQADGRQQQALAGSIAAFASFLVNTPDELPDHLLARIAHKHASLGLREEQYAIVHEHLMWAIGDVLQEAVTDDVAAAWNEVYWLMANALINQERALYRAAELTPDSVWQSWRIARKTRESDDVVTFVLQGPDGAAAAPSLPGQYVSLKVLMPDGVWQPRQYSLSRSDDGTHRQITVKRVHGRAAPDGEVSTLLHDKLEVGDEVMLSAPFGDMVLDASGRPLVFASAGIGITPHAGMISHLAGTGGRRSVTVLHADRSAPSILHHQIEGDLARMTEARMLTWTTGSPGPGTRGGQPAGRMALDSVDLPPDAVYYLCGPLAFMQSLRSTLIGRGVAPKSITYEVFGPDLWLASTN
jgi:nitric oxide dioxygenase